MSEGYGGRVAPQTVERDEATRETERRKAAGRRALIATAILVSVAFIFVLKAFLSPILWGFGLAVVFHPIFRRLADTGAFGRSTASLATVALIILLLVLPTLWLSMTLFAEAKPLIEELRHGAPRLTPWLAETLRDLPAWAKSGLASVGVSDVDNLRDRLTELITPNAILLASSAVSLSQMAVSLVIVILLALYLTFFFLRDADWLWRRIEIALPLRSQDAVTLRDDFVSVTRATIRGGGLVALLEGLIGGLGFWAAGLPSPVLWGSLMAATSFVPIVGTALVWAPAAVYLAADGRPLGMVTVLIAGGLIVLCDNFVRPLVVGKGAGLPDYLVLFSTLGGIALFGFNGVIVGPMVAAMFVSAWKVTAQNAFGREA
jgi:predicted PurR-regulated permease PerM